MVVFLVEAQDKVQGVYDPKKSVVSHKSKNLLQGNTFLLWAEQFVGAIPIYYDRSRIWWLWDFNSCRWQIVDETDILNAYRGVNDGETTIRTKPLLMEALRQVARERNPEELSKEWVQFGKKLYNMRTKNTMQSSSRYFCTNPIPWDVGSETDTPEMDKLFSEWVGNEKKDMLYEIIAYCCLSDYPIHRFFVLTGRGLNGKGMFLKVMEKFIGTYNTTSLDLDALIDKSNRFEKAKLYKKLLCVVGETNYGEMKKTGELKQLTGNDFISFEYKNKDPIQGRNYAKIVMATNSLPPTTDKTIGFHRRPLVINFPNQFTETPRLLERIPEKEYENLSRKCLELLPKILDAGSFTNEGSIEERTQAYEDFSNPLQRFLKQHTVQDPNGHIWKWELRDRFREWQEQNGYRIWSPKVISLKMLEHYEDQRLESDTGKWWFAFVGLRWKNKGDEIKAVLDEEGQQKFDASGRVNNWTPVILRNFIAKRQAKLEHAVDVSELEKLVHMTPDLLDELLKLLKEKGDVIETKPGFVEVLK